MNWRNSTLGKSVNRQQRDIRSSSPMFGATTLYKPDVSDYSKLDVSDISSGPETKRTYFVFWKTDDQPDHIPKWEDPGIQAEVLRVWKLDEARKLALKRADELKAEAAAKSGKSLKELASGKEEGLHRAAPAAVQFSDLAPMYGDIQLGDVFGLKKDGRDFKQEKFSLDKIGVPFMQKVFSLDPANQVDVATNLPKTEIYVVRAVEFTPFDELWSNFTRRCGRLVALHGPARNGRAELPA